MTYQQFSEILFFTSYDQDTLYCNYWWKRSPKNFGLKQNFPLESTHENADTRLISI